MNKSTMLIQNENDSIEIPLNKLKIVLLTIGALLFVAAGLWLWYIAERQARYDSTVVRIVALMDFLLFGLFGIIGFGKLFDTKPGIVINHIGITDNSSAIGGQTIKWDDITHLRIEAVKRTKFVLIYVNNPHQYINNANLFKKFWMNMNYRVYGTPLSISSTALACNIAELVDIINKQRAIHSTLNGMQARDRRTKV
ncbi:MAG: STM3941 family protein [Bacteroidota bacterium]